MTLGIRLFPSAGANNRAGAVFTRRAVRRAIVQDGARRRTVQPDPTVASVTRETRLSLTRSIMDSQAGTAQTRRYVRPLALVRDGQRTPYHLTHSFTNISLQMLSQFPGELNMVEQNNREGCEQDGG